MALDPGARPVVIRRHRRWWRFGTLFSIIGSVYCLSGVIMNADFAMMGSAAQQAGHRLAAQIFAALTLLCLAGSALCGVLLWRTRRFLDQSSRNEG